MQKATWWRLCLLIQVFLGAFDSNLSPRVNGNIRLFLFSWCFLSWRFLCLTGYERRGDNFRVVSRFNGNAFFSCYTWTYHLGSSKSFMIGWASPKKTAICVARYLTVWTILCIGDQDIVAGFQPYLALSRNGTACDAKVMRFPILPCNNSGITPRFYRRTPRNRLLPINTKVAALKMIISFIVSHPYCYLPLCAKSNIVLRIYIGSSNMDILTRDDSGIFSRT